MVKMNPFMNPLTNQSSSFRVFTTVDAVGAILATRKTMLHKHRRHTIHHRTRYHVDDQME
jgi:hypothetical protein